MVRKTTERAAFGDFQTPPALADEACARVAALLGRAPGGVVEPTCGAGAFLLAAARRFNAAAVSGMDVNPGYVEDARRAASAEGFADRVNVRVADFFRVDWRAEFAAAGRPLLVIGNPPWVTNSAIGTMDADNLPDKTNFKRHAGLDALTGKSNFDVSEWMLLALLDALQRVPATVAMLCKTAVARKVVEHAWDRKLKFRCPGVFRIDAMRHFGAAVDACLFVFSTDADGTSPDIPLFDSIADGRSSARWAFRDGRLVGDAESYDRLRSSIATGPEIEWRSGVKHDCAAVMELRETERGLVNGFGEVADVEPDLTYPLVKASELARGPRATGRTRVIVTQRKVGESTAGLASSAPRTWAYLRRHAPEFARRKSAVYRSQPEFSMFGVGPYTFAPWKVAVSSMHRDVRFHVVAPRDGKPTLLDDTCYFAACPDEASADRLLAQVATPDVGAFLRATVAGRSQRVVTKDVLRLLSGPTEPALPLFEQRR